MGDRPIGATGVHCGAGARCRRQEVAMIDPAFTLEKKAAIVVGAANGIGRATALAFAAAGARVACADVEEPGAKAIAAEIEQAGAPALSVHLDVTEAGSCRAAVSATVGASADSTSSCTAPRTATRPPPCSRWTRPPGTG